MYNIRRKRYVDTEGGKRMDRQKIASRLRDLRGAKSREEVAIACNVTASAISMYETGARVPSDDVKLRLAEYFRKSVQEIFFD